MFKNATKHIKSILTRVWIWLAILLVIASISIAKAPVLGIWQFGAGRIWLKLLNSPITFIVLTASLVAAWYMCRRRQRPLLMSKGKEWIFIGALFLTSLIFDPYLPSRWEEISVGVLILSTAICISFALLGRFVYLVWVPFFFIATTAYLCKNGVFQLSPTNFLAIFSTTWEDAKIYVTWSSVSVSFILLALYILTCYGFRRLFRGVARCTMIFTGLFSGMLLYIILIPVKNHIGFESNQTWPIGFTSTFAWDAAKGLRELSRIQSLLSKIPPKESAESAVCPLSANSDVICIFHLGESVRADYLSIDNDDIENTTPWMREQKGLIFYKDCTSSAAYTDKASLTVLTNGRRDFLETNNPLYLPSSPALTDFFHACNFNIATFWDKSTRDGSDMSVFGQLVKIYTRTSEKNYYHEETPDEQLQQVYDYVDSKGNANKFLLLYNYGSHLPFLIFNEDKTPFRPYRTARMFVDKPDEDPEVANLIRNAYLNTIYYTDDFIRQLVTRYEGRPVLYIYVGDHGEYLGNKDKYWYRGNAPSDAYFKGKACNVPFIVYASPEFEALHPHLKTALDRLRANKNMSIGHEHVFHTILGLFDIQTPYYDKTLDLCTPEARPYTGPHPSRNGQELEP